MNNKKLKLYQNEVEKLDKLYFDILEECYGCRMYLMCPTCSKSEQSEKLRKKMAYYQTLIDELVMKGEV